MKEGVSVSKMKQFVSNIILHSITRDECTIHCKYIKTSLYALSDIKKTQNLWHATEFVSYDQNWKALILVVRPNLMSYNTKLVFRVNRPYIRSCFRWTVSFDQVFIIPESTGNEEEHQLMVSRRHFRWKKNGDSEVLVLKLGCHGSNFWRQCRENFKQTCPREKGGPIDNWETYLCITTLQATKLLWDLFLSKENCLFKKTHDVYKLRKGCTYTCIRR
jgi:hypothetical protein